MKRAADAGRMRRGVGAPGGGRSQSAGSMGGASFGLLFDSNPNPMWIFDTQTLRFLAVNEAAVNLYGWSRKEFLRMSVKDIRPPRDVPMLMKRLAVQNRSQAVSIGEWRHWKKDHTTIDAEVTVSCIRFEGRDARLAMVRDVTESRKIEAALRESEQRLRLAARAANVGFWDWDLKTNRVYFSPEWKRQLGYREDELTDRFDEWETRVHPEDLQPALERVRAYLAKPEGQHEHEVRMRHKDGSFRWIYTLASAECDAQGRATRMLGCHLDITARKQSETALARANRALHAVGACNEALLRCTNERELFQEICRIIVEIGGYQMAWVGLAEQDAKKTLLPVAHAGDARGFPSKRSLTWKASPRDGCAAGIAIRTRKPALVRNLAKGHGGASLRQFSRQTGAVAALGLPLMSDGQCLGAVTIFSDDPLAFDDREMKLMRQLANDLAFGVMTLRLQAERKRLEREVIGIREREEQRIGRELHDGICQILSGAKYNVELLAEKIRRDMPLEHGDTHLVKALLAEAIQQSRDLSYGLNPVRPEPSGLMEALKHLCARLHASGGMRCACKISKPVHVADHSAATHLFRIVQEAAQNAQKHGRARNLAISLSQKNHVITLRIADDGVGLPARRTGNGMGLSNMASRAQLIGGKVEFMRGRHRGTIVVCKVPVPLQER